MRKTATSIVMGILLCMLSTLTFAQEALNVSGHVKDNLGHPVPGVSVSIKNTGKASAADADGNFTLKNVPQGAILVFSAIGYANKELEATSSMQVTLETSVQDAGGEVVVTAMGIKKDKRKLGYAVSSVSGADIVKSSPTNFASALYGKAAGVKIQSAPGGGTSAVSIQIRGINSLFGANQPLIVVDGVPIRNGEANTEDYWSNPRINGNGLLDINPENVADISILKGSAASSLYGSDAANGVVVITTKSGSKAKGIGVDLNLTYGLESVGVVPDVQTEYGPGYDRATNVANGADEEGWFHGDFNGDGKEDTRPYFRAYGQFGPKLDGRQVYWWDGQFRSYSPHANNWKSVYRTGSNDVASLAVYNSTDKFKYRFSYTRNDYKGIQIGGDQQKNTFNLNTSYKINNKLSTDIIVNYVNELVHNRPMQLGQVMGSYDGFFSPADYMDVYMNKFQTSHGYKYVQYNQSYDDAEKIQFPIRAYNYMDFLWTQLKNNFDEKSNRLMSSFTLNYEIAKGLKFRGRFGNDYTGYDASTEQYALYPLAFGTSGGYSVNSNLANIFYGDLLLTYNKNISKDIVLNATAGYQARNERYRNNSIGTVDGLIQENWFSIAASKNPTLSVNSYNQYLSKDGLFGVVGAEFKNFLFIEGSLRYERTSTLAPGNNTFYYPSVSASVELNKLLNLPSFIDYSKFRSSYGVTGNPPGRYLSNVVYMGGSINGTPSAYPSASFGNEGLQNERKNEYEFGLEVRMFKGRFGFDIGYYNATIHNQITQLDIASSTGASKRIMNVGDMRNQGVEVSLNGIPVQGRNFEWRVRVNAAYNNNKVISLISGVDQLVLANVDNSSALIVAKPGSSSGDIVTYKRATDEKGNNIITSDGYYQIDYDKYQKVGNIQPFLVGGVGNTFNYKNWTMDFLVDFRWGGQMLSTTNLYGTGAGMYKSTLAGRDEEHGGLPYYVDANGKNVQLPSHTSTAPNGAKVYHDGIVLKGVTADGKANDQVLEAANYYLNTYSWGGYSGAGNNTSYESAVYDNNYIKLREITLSYTFPVKLKSKVKAQNLSLGLYGRNLFYFYKSIPNLDPEAGISTNFVKQAIDAGSTAASRSYGVNLRLSF